MHKIVKYLSLNICYVIYVLSWIKYWLMWFESLLVFILFKFKKRPNISGTRVVYCMLSYSFAALICSVSSWCVADFSDRSLCVSARLPLKISCWKEHLWSDAELHDVWVCVQHHRPEGKHMYINKTYFIVSKLTYLIVKLYCFHLNFFTCKSCSDDKHP